MYVKSWWNRFRKCRHFILYQRIIIDMIWILLCSCCHNKNIHHIDVYFVLPRAFDKRLSLDRSHLFEFISIDRQNSFLFLYPPLFFIYLIEASVWDTCRYIRPVSFDRTLWIQLRVVCSFLAHYNRVQIVLGSSRTANDWHNR